MKFNINKNINLNSKINKEILIGGVAIATITTVAIICNKASKKKKALQNRKEEELASLVDELENISIKIVELSQNQEQLELLAKEKAILKDNFTLKPY